MVAEPSRRVGRLVVELQMPAGLPAESRGPLEQAARGCPVRESLHPDVVLELSIDWL
jgi:putative redox protein